MSIDQDAIPVLPQVFPVSECLLADHRVFRVWRFERRLLCFDLFSQNCLTGSCGDEAEEGRGWIERSAAELGVGLQRDEEGVVCQSVEREVPGVSMTNGYM